MIGAFFILKNVICSPKTKSPALKIIYTLFLFITFLSCTSQKVYCQLNITAMTTAQGLAQKLVGSGVTISNVVLTGVPESAGFFNNISGTQIGLDSGIVLTNGKAKSNAQNSIVGMDGNGITNSFANNQNGFAGDISLADLLNLPITRIHDACVLEFDFIPVGDSIKFKYVFSSEEYPHFACPIGPNNYNDAFAFFISGPGFPGLTNIALIPGTSQPVTINNINDQPCALFPQFYVDNINNVFFNHNGHTKIFTAQAKVQPSTIYHLKLVIADVEDYNLDSGVFIEAGSLSSNSYSLTNLTQTDAQGNSYVVEGCTAGAVKIKRASATPQAETIMLSYGGTAINGTDIQTIPGSVVIPANQTETLLNIIPVIDNIPEGIEVLKVYTLSPYDNNVKTDSTFIQIRDYDILQLSPGMAPDTAFICRNTTQMITATTGYATYKWDADPALDDVNSRTPVAAPLTTFSKYYCTAALGTCHARDSVNIKWKDFSVLSKMNINCAGGTTGQIKTEAGSANEWIRPLEFWEGAGAHQSDSVFNNLPAGNYWIKIKDNAGCVDSLNTSLIRSFPDLTATLTPTDPSCLGGADGKIVVAAAGGNPSYLFSVDGGVFQSSNSLITGTGPHVVTIKDQSGCTKNINQTLVFINTVSLTAGGSPTICEGDHTSLSLTSNGQSFEWSPAETLTGAGTSTPVAAPTVTTKYYIKAITGICYKIDSLIVNVKPAPIPEAGNPETICYAADTHLHGSNGVSFTWTPAINLSSTIDPNPAVTHSVKTQKYYLSVIGANGCSSLVQDSVKITVTPIVRISAGPDTSFAIAQPVQLHVSELSTAGVINYTWTPTYGLSNPGSASPIATLDKDMIYYIKGTTAANCEGFDTLKVKVYKGPQIYVPNIFSPNGDNLNDVLRPLAFGMKEYHYFRVYNRLGQMVYSTADFKNGWDGKIGGVMQPTGTFVWVAEAIDYKGNLIQRKGSSILMH